MLTVGSLFSGIGGLDLGLERAGMKVIWNSEIDPYACRVLKKHWPEVPNVGDIKQVDWADVARPDVLCGGYPCQPFSTAGKRQGEEDPRHLWPWVRQAIRLLRPHYAILENVRGHLSLGGATVISEIAALGYCAEWRIVSAASVGANHRRDRVIILAYPNRRIDSNGSEHEIRMVAYPDSSYPSNGRERQALPGEDRSGGDDRGGSDGDPWQVPIRGTGEDHGSLAYADSERLQECDLSGIATRQGEPYRSPNESNVADTDLRQTGGRDGRDEPNRGEVFSRGNIGRGTASYEGWKWWETEPGMGRVAHGIPHRVDRLRGLGNAVVPQVAEIIGRLVIQHHQTTQKDPDT